MPKNIFAVKDTHSDSAGRLRARGMLLSGGIDVFFIEWPRPVERNNIAASFLGLAQGDAIPTLRELAELALGRGIDVVSCDLTADATVERLNARNDGYGPYGQLSAFQAWGKAIRDRNAAEVIRAYMANKLSCRGLLMFGSDHFVAEDGRGEPPLHKLVKAVSGVDCFIVDNNSTAVDF